MSSNNSNSVVPLSTSNNTACAQTTTPAAAAAIIPDIYVNIPFGQDAIIELPPEFLNFSSSDLVTVAVEEVEVQVETVTDNHDVAQLQQQQGTTATSITADDVDRNNAQEADQNIPVAIEESHNPVGTDMEENETGSDSEEDRSVLYTRKGELRKRRKKLSALAKEAKKQKKVEKMKLAHGLLSPCTAKCPRKCTTKINEVRRQQLNKDFWNMPWEMRNVYLKQAIHQENTNRTSCGATSRRTHSLKFQLRNEVGSLIDVCRTFFLTTLGFKKNNNTMIKKLFPKVAPSHQELLETTVPIRDPRGRHSNRPNIIDRALLDAHVMSFQPCISHYRREHAPHRLYLPSDITIQLMYDDFKEKNPKVPCSYSTYRTFVRDVKKISFTKLGHEECESCEYFSMHDVNHKNDSLDPNCNECQQWKVHIDKATAARKVYRKDANSLEWEAGKRICVSVDLEKVIMLPRIDTFKQVHQIHLPQQNYKIYLIALHINLINFIFLLCRWFLRRESLSLMKVLFP